MFSKLKKIVFFVLFYVINILEVYLIEFNHILIKFIVDKNQNRLFTHLLNLTIAWGTYKHHLFESSCSNRH